MILSPQGQAPVDTESFPRFWSKVQIGAPDECWIWQAGRQTSGYGHFYDGHTYTGAHRFAYRMHWGEIPTKHEVDHKCFTKLCVNPLHLQAVTRKQNQENPKGVRSHSRSGIRGVIWREDRQVWRAYVTHNGKRKDLGQYDTKEDAAAAALAGRMERFTNNLVDRGLTA